MLYDDIATAINNELIPGDSSWCCAHVVVGEVGVAIQQGNGRPRTTEFFRFLMPILCLKIVATARKKVHIL
jgi:hypothetical protein